MKNLIELLEQGNVPSDHSDIKIYQESYTNYDQVHLLMVKDDSKKLLLAAGAGSLFDELDGEKVGDHGKACPLTHENRLVLNRYFDYTVPRAFGTDLATIGLGDRLGLASPGHIQTIKDKAIKPVLAQQSIRELTLCERTMTDMLDDAS